MLKQTSSFVLASFRPLNWDPAASPLGGAHRLGARYLSPVPPKGTPRISLAVALLDGLLELPAGL